MTWNVRIFDSPEGRWLGVVYATTEQEARHAALSTFNIPSRFDFAVSPR